MQVGFPRAGVAAYSLITWRRGVACLILAHFALLLWLGLTRHWGLLTSLNDLGVYDQAVWGILHGAPFLNTSSALNTPINWLGFHFNPILAVFAPLYLVAEAAEWLILAQALALSLSAWPIFLLAIRVIGSERTASLWVLAYLANPFLLNAAAWDFHAVSLGVPFIALGLLAIESKNLRLLVGSCLILLTVQEHVGPLVAGLGLLWGIRNSSWRIGSLFALLGIGHTLVVLGLIMPALSPTHSHPMLNAGLGQLSRYSWMGNSLGEIASYPFLHPGDFLKTVLFDFGGVVYLIGLLFSFLLLPLAGIAFLLPGMADLAANLLSANTMPRSPLSYHSVGLIPILTIAAIQGGRVLCGWQQRFKQSEFAGMTAVTSICLGYILAPLPLPGATDFWAAKYYPWGPDPILPEVKSIISVDDSLSVQANVGAYFSQRKAIYLFPAGLAGCSKTL